MRLGSEENNWKGLDQKTGTRYEKDTNATFGQGTYKRTPGTVEQEKHALEAGIGYVREWDSHKELRTQKRPD